MKRRIKDNEKKTLSYFQESDVYKHLYTNVLYWCVTLANYAIININAPVKSGKRYMAIIAHLYFMKKDELDGINSKSYFITSLYRKDDVKQRNQLQNYGLKVVTPTNIKKANKWLEELKNDFKKYDKVYVHIDENDYGAGNTQILSYFWKLIVKQVENNNSRVFTYSATGEITQAEFIEDSNIKEIIKNVNYEPPRTYYGIGCYIRDHRMHDATDFFTYKVANKEEDDVLDYTGQSQRLTSELMLQTKERYHKRHIGILRLSGKVTKKRGRTGQQTKFEFVKKFKNDIEADLSTPECQVRLLFVSSKDGSISWDEYKYWLGLEKSIAWIIIVNEMAKRSTQFRCHPFVCWYHTYRPSGSLATITQDQERPAFYWLQPYLKTNKINPRDIKIHIYGNIKCAKYSAHWEGFTGKEGYNKLCNSGIQLANCCRWAKPRTRGDWTYEYGNERVDHIKELKEIALGINEKSTMGNTNDLIKDITEFHISRLKETKYIKYKFGKKIPYGNNKRNGKPKIYNIHPDIYNKYKEYDGYVMTTERGDRKNWIINATKGIDMGKPIKFYEDLDLGPYWSDGKRTFNINVYYDKHEKNKNNYKFSITYIQAKVKRGWVTNNKSMYNTLYNLDSESESESE